MAFKTSERGATLLVIQVLCLALVWIAIALRIWIKTAIIKKRTWDDIWMYFSVLLYTILATLVLHGITKGGVGQDADNLNLHKIAVGLRAWYFGELTYGLLSVFVRLSVALFLLRICTKSSHKWILTACLVVVIVTSLVYLCATLFQCLPVTYYWQRFELEERAGHCSTARLVPNTAIVLSIVAAISDWLIALIPAVILSGTRIPRSSKILATGLMSIGVLAGIAMIVRIPYIKSTSLTPDFLHASVGVAIWTVIEPCLGIVGGSAATFGPLFHHRSRKSATRSVGSPRHADIWSGTTVTVNGGRGNSTDIPPPPQGIGVVRKVICTREKMANEEQLDYHRFLKAVS
ncbi:hypothetical protein FALCPG4_015304 [Fusarium falciforme]